MADHGILCAMFQHLWSHLPPFADTFYSSWAIVVITGFGVYAALKSLRLVRQQADAATVAANAAADSVAQASRSNDIAKVTAEAALKSANATIVAERAWVFVDVTWIPGYQGIMQGSYGDGTKVVYAGIRFVLSNEGRSPCWITSLRASLSSLEKLLGPASQVGTLEELLKEPASIAVGKVHFVDNPFASPTGSGITVLTGVVEYRDAFNAHLETIFAFEIESSRFTRMFGEGQNVNK